MAVYWICGIENMAIKEKQEAHPDVEMDTSIDEDPCWSQIMNSIAIVLMIATAFMWGFFA